MELIFYLGDKPVSTDSNKSINENTIITGQLSEYYDLKISGKLSLFSILFQPHGLSMFLDISINELHNHSVLLKFIFKNNIDELSTQINKLKDVYEYDFLQKNKTINAGLSLFLTIITFGIWGIVVIYKLNKAWDNLQRAEQKFYDELNPILTKLELTKYPINFRIKTNKTRSFILYLFLTIITFGIWGIVWDYKIHTDADDLYPEFHTGEDSVLGAIKQ